MVLLLLNNCSKDNLSTDSFRGSLRLTIGLFISVNEVENRLKSTQNTDDFLVIIYNNLESEVMRFGRAAEIPDEIELDPGQYYVVAHSNNDVPAAFDNPYYYGESAMFEITSGGQQSVTVNCELANTMVTIIYSDAVKANYDNYETTVSTTEGSLVFSKDETRAGYFRPKPMNISVVLTFQKDGTTRTKILKGVISDPQPKKKYEIHVDASPEGTSSIQINLDPLAGSIEIVNIDETNEIIQGPIAEGELLITEIMYDPMALTDNEGEWFEIYNTTDREINLYQVVILANNEVKHTINENITINPGEYFVIAKTTNAVAVPDYVYGGMSLTNSGMILSLANYGTNGKNGSLICAINYGLPGFPSGQGASICLSPALLNYSSAVSGDSWCVSRSGYSTGDKGTPGTINDVCE